MTRRGFVRRMLPGLLLTAIALLLPIEVSAQQRVNRRIAIAPDVSIKVWVAAGTIRLVGWDRDSLVVEGTLSGGAKFYFGGSGSAAKFGIEEGAMGKDGPRADLVAYVPRGGMVVVRSVTGSIDVTDLSGSFNTVGGDIRISGTARDVTAEAMDGTIRMDVDASYARARTASGALVAGGRVEDFAAATVSGPLTVNTAGIVRGRFESVTGAIVLSGRLDPSASVEVDSHGGAVELHLPVPLTGELRLTSVTGTVTNGLDKRLPVVSRKGRGQELAWVTGKDGPQIVVRTFKGGIVLRPHKSPSSR